MSGAVLDAWRTIVPRRDDPHAALLPSLVALTVVTGLVDAFSCLQLGRVFVANMTGNVVFLSFALGGVHEFVWWASLIAIGTFLVGALLGGRLAGFAGGDRLRQLLLAAGAELVLVAAALVLAAVADAPPHGGRYADAPMAVLIVLLGIGLGLQNATARSLAVPDMTTTVLTLTITGIAADSTAAGGHSSRIGRRFVAIASMFAGGLVGALLVVHGHGQWSLAAATLLLAAVVAGTALRVRQAPPPAD